MKLPPKISEATFYTGAGQFSVLGDEDTTIQHQISPVNGRSFVLVRKKSKPGWSRAYFGFAFSVEEEESAIYNSPEIIL
jgi:hypothetical protein